MFAAANYAAYQNLLYMKSKKPIFSRTEYVIAFGHYQQGIEKLQSYIRENAIFLNQKVALESRHRGLIILDAYFGLDEHIYHVDAGILIYKHPKTVQDYCECQLVPIRKKLQLMVENSQLVLERSHFRRS